MAKKQLPKAQLGAIIKGASKFGKIISGTVKGAKAGYKRAIKVKPVVKPKSQLKAAAETTIKRGPGRPKTTGNVQEIPEVIVKGSRAKTVKGTKKTPFVKSKGRLAFENYTGKVIGGFPFYMLNATGKVLKNPIAQGIIGGAGTLAAANRWKKTNAPKKAKRFKEK